MKKIKIAISLFALMPTTILADSVLASYNFDADLAEVGPDTYQIFQNDYGRVSISSTFSHSGSKSLKIKDVESDGDFPEIQGHYPTLDYGRLDFQFAVLFTNVEEKFNIALAGNSHFKLVNHGIAFWLDNYEGQLRHYVNKKPVRLFELQPFLWYLVRLAYDIDSGRYDLVISDEHGNVWADLFGFICSD